MCCGCLHASCCGSPTGLRVAASGISPRPADGRGSVRTPVPSTMCRWFAEAFRRRGAQMSVSADTRARNLAAQAELRGRAGGHRAGVILYDIMSEMMARRDNPPSLFAALLTARQAHGGKHPVLADPTAESVTYDRVVAASLIFGCRLPRVSPPPVAFAFVVPYSLCPPPSSPLSPSTL